MKIIFLDIDGVLNSGEYAMRCHKNNDTSTFFRGMMGLCPILVQRYKNLVEKTGAKVVLSSTWRLTKEHKNHLFDNGIRTISQTPSLYREGGIWSSTFDRRDEIRQWLLRFGMTNVEDFVIIDDDSDASIDGHFYKTEYDTGLTEEICNQIIERWSK